MVAYASELDVTARLGRELTNDEVVKLPGLLEEASLLVDGHCGRAFDPVPDAVRVAVSKVVAQSMSAPAGFEGVTSEQQVAGPYSQQRSFASEGQSVWLGASVKLMLRPYRVGVVSVQLVSDRGVL